MKRFLVIFFTLLFIASVSYATVENTTLPPVQYSGNDLTTDFPITFDYNSESDLIVSVVDSDGDVTEWTQGAVGDAGYTIVSDEVVANTAPETGETLVINSETALTQTLNLKNNRKTAAELLEAALDKNTLISRDNAAKLERALLAPATGDPDVSYILPDYEASSYIQWDPSSKELRNFAIANTADIGTGIGQVVALVDDGDSNGIIPLAQRFLIDEDDFTSDTDEQSPTQQSIKAYVATEIAAVDVGAETTAANEWEKHQYYGIDTLSISTGTLTWDVETYPVAQVSLTENITTITLQNTQPGGGYELTLIQDATGSRTVAFPAGWLWPASTAPTITAAASSEDIISLSVRGTSGSPVIRAIASQNFGN